MISNEEYAKYIDWCSKYPEFEDLEKLGFNQIYGRFKEHKLPTSADDAHGDWGWLTINPKPDTSLKDFVTSAKELSRFKCFESITYVFEQRSVDPATPEGLHLHAVFKRKSAPSACEYKIRRKFDRFCGSSQHIVLKWVDKPASDIKLNYILGSKTDTKDDPTKTAKQSVDKIWRKLNNLQDCYAHPILVGALTQTPFPKKKLILRQP